MKKYLVIGNPINHSLSPRLHGHWLKKNKVVGVYEKEKLDESHLENLILRIRNKEIHGVNVTVPFKRKIIPFLDELTPEAQSTKSVNTVYLKKNKVVGHNTDTSGFEQSIKDSGYNVSGKKILILGAGGVAPSIIFALYKMKAANIMLSNRTKINAENLKILFNKLNVINWGEIPDFDMIINTTSIGLKSSDEFDFNLSKLKGGDFFYDVIYNPPETRFLKNAKQLGKKTENGIKMFIYQAAESFEIWHGIRPQIDEETKKLLGE